VDIWRNTLINWHQKCRKHGL